MTTDLSVTSAVLLTQAVCVANGSVYPFYGSVERADSYFASMLEGQRWCCTDRTRKTRALVSATQRIEQLNFVGVKASPSQPLQFPRGTDTRVPVAIEQACYHLAQALLKGIDPDTEADNLSATLQMFGGIRSEHDRSIVNVYIRAGIPNQTAWNLLLPYLDPRYELLLRRV